MVFIILGELPKFAWTTSVFAGVEYGVKTTNLPWERLFALLADKNALGRLTNTSDGTDTSEGTFHRLNTE